MLYYKIDFNQLLRVRSLGFEHLCDKRLHLTRTVGEYVLYVVTAGTLSILLNGDPFTLEKGGAVLFEKGDTQAPLGICDCEYIWCHFESDNVAALPISEKECRALIAERKEQSGKAALHSAQSYAFCYAYVPKASVIRDAALFSYVVTALRKCAFTPEARRPEKRFLISAALADVLFHLEDAENKYGRHYLANRLVQYIEKNYNQNLSSEDFEAAFSLGIDHLNRICKRTVGQSIVAFRNSLRIEVAKELLLSETLPLQEIAWRLGFENYHYFSRLFKREVKLSPQEYRKAYNT